MSKTVVGLFKSTAEAEQVKQSLVSKGYSANDIRIVSEDQNDDLSSSSSVDYERGRGAGLGRDTDLRSGEYISNDLRSGTDLDAGTGFGRDGEDIGTDAGLHSSNTGIGTIGSGSGAGTTARRAAGAAEGAAEGIGQKISNFFRSLTGDDEEAHGHYSSGVNQGGAVLTVRTEDENASEVADLLRQHGARDIEGGSRQTSGVASPAYGSETGANARNRTGETAIPVIEEQLEVGKREVDRGGVRVYSHVVERPAEANVTLRDERVNVERRPADRAATEADLESARDQSIEVRATGEEAVVGKTSRVVEEVLIGKESNERTEAVRDTVRKTEVEVEQIAGKDMTTAGGDTSEKNRY